MSRYTSRRRRRSPFTRSPFVPSAPSPFALTPTTSSREPIEVDRIRYKRFDSVTEFCTQPFVNAANERSCRNVLGAEEGKWSTGALGSGIEWLGGTHDANVAAERVYKGWPEGAQRVLSDLESLEVPTPIKVRRRVVRGPQGDELDIHAVYRGDLDHAWTSRRRQRERGPFAVRIVAQTNMLAHFTGEQMFWRGAAAVKAIDLLSDAGYSVEVIGILASDHVAGNDCTYFAQSFPLKEAGTPLDVAQLAGVLCNAGFHRLFGFRAYAASVPNDHHVGSASSNTDGRVPDALVNDSDGIPTFRVPYNIASKAQAEQWIAELVKQLQPEEQQA